MSHESPSSTNKAVSFLAIIGAFLIFFLIVLVAYLPNRAPAVDTEVRAQRIAAATEARSASQKKLTTYTVLDAEAGTVQIPIEAAMEATVKAYGGAAPEDAAE